MCIVFKQTLKVNVVHFPPVKFPLLFLIHVYICVSGWQTGTRAQMIGVMEGSTATAAVPNTCVDWQKRCIALEEQLIRFRLQAGNIRHLLAERVSKGNYG